MSLQTLTQILQVVNTPLVNPVAKPSNLSWDDFTGDRKNKYEVDPLVCSVAFHRTNKSYGLSGSVKEALPEDYETAKKIREYYSKKYFWNSLKETRPQSEYRINAMRLLAITEDWELTDRDAGLFVKLPAFYTEDIVYDRFKETLKTTRGDTETAGKEVNELPLIYLGKTFRWQKVKRESFWFKDSQDRLYAYTTTHGHPFNALFEDIVQTPQRFKGRIGVDRVAELWYNDIKTFTIVKD